MAESFIAANFMMNSESEDDRLRVPINIPAQTQFNSSAKYGFPVGIVPGHATFTLEWNAMSASIRCVGGMGSQFSLTLTTRFDIDTSQYSGNLIGSTVFNGYTINQFSIPANDWTFTTEEYQEAQGTFYLVFNGAAGQFLFETALTGELLVSWA